MSLVDYEEQTSKAVREYLGSALPDSEVKRARSEW